MARKKNKAEVKNPAPAPVEMKVETEVVDLDAKLAEVKSTSGYGFQAIMREKIKGATKRG